MKQSKNEELSIRWKRETFRNRQLLAEQNTGTVMPELAVAEFIIVDIPKHPYIGSGKEAIQKAMLDAKKNIVGIHTDNRKNGFGVYRISKDTIDEFVNKFSRSLYKSTFIAVMNHIPILVENSVEVEEHPDYLKKSGVRSVLNGTNKDVLMHVIYCAARVDGCLYRVRILMKEFFDPEFINRVYAYELNEIELIDAPTEKTSESPVGSVARTSVSSITGAKLLKDIDKSYAPGVKLIK